MSFLRWKLKRICSKLPIGGILLILSIIFICGVICILPLPFDTIENETMADDNALNTTNAMVDDVLMECLDQLLSFSTIIFVIMFMTSLLRMFMFDRYDRW